MSRHAQIMARDGINGVVATVVRYGALAFNLNVLNFTSAGAANLCAAVFGISAFIWESMFCIPSSWRSHHRASYEMQWCVWLGRGLARVGLAHMGRWV